MDEILLECNEHIKNNYYGFEIQFNSQNTRHRYRFLELETQDIQMTELNSSQMFLEYSVKCKQSFLFVENMWFYCNQKTNMIWVNTRYN